jgi:hypothetical protein
MANSYPSSLCALREVHRAPPPLPTAAFELLARHSETPVAHLACGKLDVPAAEKTLRVLQHQYRVHAAMLGEGLLRGAFDALGLSGCDETTGATQSQENCVAISRVAAVCPVFSGSDALRSLGGYSDGLTYLALSLDGDSAYSEVEQAHFVLNRPSDRHLGEMQERWALHVGVLGQLTVAFREVKTRLLSDRVTTGLPAEIRDNIYAKLSHWQIDDALFASPHTRLAFDSAPRLLLLS